MKYAKTEAGQQAFKARSVLLSARQRSAFILFDGAKSLDQVLAATAGLGITRDDVDYLVGHGFLAASSPAAELTAQASTPTPVEPSFAAQRSSAAPSAHSAQERYSRAMPIATQLTASLGLRGFRLNLAVEAAAGFDDLLALLPKIQAAVGVEPCLVLERALKD
jgi:hypothetical protein